MKHIGPLLWGRFMPFTPTEDGLCQGIGADFAFKSEFRVSDPVCQATQRGLYFHDNFSVQKPGFLVNLPFQNYERVGPRMLKRNTKICSRCGEEKPVTDFYSQKGGRSGLRAACKTCFIKANSDYRSKRKNGVRLGSRDYFLELKRRKETAVDEK